MNLNRRNFLQHLGLGAVGLSIFSQSQARPNWAALAVNRAARTNSLPRSLPSSQGVMPGGLLNFVNALETENLNVHSLMVVRHGQVVAEGWWSPYTPDLKHTLYSLSKSFTSTAVGMAVAEGKLNLDDKVISFFKADLPETISDNLAAMRVQDLLTMTAGHHKDTTPAVRGNGNQNWIKAFLAQPVEHQPGTYFVYNSGATYMLSAIVQQRTGKTVLDYLKPRLFVPLGIEGADWEIDPNGINTGGWGLRVRTEDIAKFGQLYLQKGIWNGKRLIAENWIADATQSHILQPTPDEANRAGSDWLQGYGYQFWRCRHDAYRGDGAFGQYCIVLPSQDAVIAITAESGNMPAILNAVWTHILPALKTEKVSSDKAISDSLTQKLKTLALPLPAVEANAPMAETVSGKTYNFADNTLKIAVASVVFEKNDCVFTLQDQQGKHQVRCGINQWAESKTTVSVMPMKLVMTPVPGETQTRVAGTGTWIDATTFMMTWRFIETAHYETVTCQFGADNTVTLTFKSSLSIINKTQDPRPVLQGKLQA
jgi:CubicO group peptidase (beta-lactamase class C family)